MAVPLPSRSFDSSYRNGRAVSTLRILAVMPRSLLSLADSPSRIVSPKRPTAHASRKTTRLTRPSVTGRARPLFATSIALSSAAGTRSDIAKLLKVPSGMTPMRHLVSASRRTTAPTVPSPPATTTFALGVTRLRIRFSAPNRSTVWSENSRRRRASISELSPPERELSTRSCAARIDPTRLSNPGGSSVTNLRPFRGLRSDWWPAIGGYEVLVALIVLILLLILFGGGGMLAASLNFLWWILIIGLMLWIVGFFFRAAEGGGRWYYW